MTFATSDDSVGAAECDGLIAFSFRGFPAMIGGLITSTLFTLRESQTESSGADLTLDRHILQDCPKKL
jgi:hypothetical protein